jgi:hypothetical protein
MAWPPIRGRFRFAGLVIFLIALASLTSSGYQQRLDSEAIRGAFNLGRKNSPETAAFLAQYFRRFPMPEKGPYITNIELLTPYAHLVEDAMLGLVNENVFDLQRKYASRAEVVLVRVRVSSTPTSILPSRDEDIWKEFAIRASEEDELKYEKKSLNHVYPGDGSDANDYADLELQFDTKTVASAPITIDVSSTDGQHVEAKFNLSKLK